MEEHEFEDLGKSELEQNDPEQDDLDQDDLDQDDLDQDDFEPDDLEQDDLEQDDFDQDSLEEDGDALIVEMDRSLPVAPTPGCAVSFYTDNKRHHAVCLAVINDELLLEHKGASRCFLFTGKVVEIVQRLRFGVASATITAGMLKSCRYRSVPKKWLQEMIKTGQTWKGIERGGELAPQPCDLVKDNGQLELF